MLFFVDESGQDHQDTPYQVLAGVAIREQDLWNLIQAVQSLENEIFGVRLSDMGVELKGKKLLKSKTFRHAQELDSIESEARRALCAEFLQKGRREVLGGQQEPRKQNSPHMVRLRWISSSASMICAAHTVLKYLQ